MRHLPLRARRRSRIDANYELAFKASANGPIATPLSAVSRSMTSYKCWLNICGLVFLLKRIAIRV